MVIEYNLRYFGFMCSLSSQVQTFEIFILSFSAVSVTCQLEGELVLLPQA